MPIKVESSTKTDDFEAVESVVRIIWFKLSQTFNSN